MINKQTLKLKKMTNSNELTKGQIIAGEILRQMGGMRRINAMTGAKNFLATERGVQFQLPKKANKIKYIKIELNGWDTYNVTFQGHVRKVNKENSFPGFKMYDETFPIVKKWEGVEGLYFDQLVSTFEKYTGLYLSL